MAWIWLILDSVTSDTFSASSTIRSAFDIGTPSLAHFVLLRRIPEQTVFALDGLYGPLTARVSHCTKYAKPLMYGEIDRISALFSPMRGG
jgi:hypothetical protein